MTGYTDGRVGFPPTDADRADRIESGVRWLKPMMSNFVSSHMKIPGMTLERLFERDSEGRFVLPDVTEKMDAVFEHGTYTSVRNEVVDGYIAGQLASRAAADGLY